MKLSLLACSIVASPAIGCQKPPQSPVGKPIKIESTRNVKFDSHGLMLEGTLQLPIGATSKVPAILLLPGSGPTDRNGNSGLGITTDLLKQIAEELAKNGIASLRFDKRAIKIYASKWPKDLKEVNKFFSWQNFVDDAGAALDFLGKQPEIDEKRTGILGHSEGALLSLQLGSDRSALTTKPKVTILLGSTGRPMGIILHEQIARQLKLAQATPELTKQYLDYVDAACKAVADKKDLPPNMPPNLGGLFNPTTMDIMGAYCRIDPSENAKRVIGPVLVMNGQKDTQVSSERDTPRLLEALKARKSGIFESMIVPDASHNFKSTKFGTDDAFEGPVIPEALALIIKFAKANL
jgi:pimeloyl-ACP methyl ester carboxylesterase